MQKVFTISVSFLDQSQKRKISSENSCYPATSIAESEPEPTFQDLVQHNRISFFLCVNSQFFCFPVSGFPPHQVEARKKKENIFRHRRKSFS
jgi:hypothetical protein